MNFLKNTSSLREAGAITMSSKYVVKQVLKHLPHKLDTVVEYGPGTGVMTEAILERLSPQGKLLAIEANSGFTKALNQLKDARLRILHGKAQHLAPSLMNEFSHADAVVSSIPFTFVESTVRLKILSDAYEMLAPGGTLIIFHQYTPLMFYSLYKMFRSVTIEFEVRNIFPCFMMVAKK
ncbi:MAG: methyltransferase domain-containing protein [Patescibacteria group bacterium]